MKALLTGGTGFVGGHLAELLGQRGIELRALVRKTSDRAALQKAGVELIEGDVGDPDSLERALTGVDTVLHVAGLTKTTSRSAYYRVNGEGTRLLAQTCAARKSPPRFVLVSSLTAAGPSTSTRLRLEDDPPAPVSHYGRSKLQGEEAARVYASTMPVTIVRPPIVYGPRDKDFLQVFKMARWGLALKAGFSEKLFSVIHVRDLCEGILLAATKGKTLGKGGEGIYFFSDGGAYSWSELCQRAGAALGKKTLVIPVPEVFSLFAAIGAEVGSRLTRSPQIMSFDKVREMRAPAWTCSIDRARTDLSYVPRLPLAEGLAQTAAWYREQGWI